MAGKLAGQFGRPAGSQVREQLFPRRQAGPLDDPVELRPQIATRIAIARNAVFGPFFGRVPSRLQILPQFRKQRNHAAFASLVMFGLGAVHREPAVGPIDVAPAQAKMLARAAQSAESRQGKNQLPFMVGASGEDLGGVFARQEIIPLVVRLAA
ncbi:MAG TPA: hypothetical protein VFE24_13570 [Pirellulales bacterium]|nr:hypothetical protein [Pirellulales bacterium]